MDVKGYYSTLGVSENATQDEIKKAYRALCMKWHPDRWATGTEEEKKKAEDEFKKVAEAYNTLGDEQKKKEYDSGFGDEGFDPNFSPFANWFRNGGGWSPFTSPFGGAQKRAPGHVGEDVETFVTLTFAESLQDNLKKTVKVKRKVKCQDCNGTGSEDGKAHECSYCHGSGLEAHTERSGNMFKMYQTDCPHCHGTGQQIDHPCKKCNGTGLVVKEEDVELQIPTGLRNGMTIVYGQLGSEGTGGYKSGNLIVHITVTQDIPGYFRTVENDLNVYHDEKVSFVDALLGEKITVKCPDGSDWTIKLRECTQPGERFTKSRGGYLRNDGYQATKGDYVVFIQYDVPSKLTKAQRKALEEYKKEK